jgi:hypothetical protein
VPHLKLIRIFLCTLTPHMCTYVPLIMNQKTVPEPNRAPYAYKIGFWECRKPCR